MKRRMIAIVMIILMTLLLSVSLYADIPDTLDSAGHIWDSGANGEDLYRPDGDGARAGRNMQRYFLMLNGTNNLRTSFLLSFARDMASQTSVWWPQDVNSERFSNWPNWFNADWIANHEVAIIRATRNFPTDKDGGSKVQVPVNIFTFFPKGTVLDYTSVGTLPTPDFLCYYVGSLGNIAPSYGVGYTQQAYMASKTKITAIITSSDWIQNTGVLQYYSGSLSNGSIENPYDYTDDGDYKAPAFEFLCFRGELPAAGGDGVLPIHCFPYLYYKIYSGSDDISRYSLRIYEDSMFSDKDTLRAEISYDEMKGLAKDKTYTYIQSINTYFPIGKNLRYRLVLFNRTTGTEVYSLQVKTAGMANHTPNVEHQHYWAAEDGNTIGRPSDYNDTGFFQMDDIVGPYDPYIPPGTSWNGPNTPTVDWTNLGDLQNWFKTIGNYGSEFIGYCSSVFTFIPASIWALIGLSLAVAILLRIFGR